MLLLIGLATHIAGGNSGQPVKYGGIAFEAHVGTRRPPHPYIRQETKDREILIGL